MNDNYYKMDLHIHTPASKCYTGPKNDEEYFAILKAAHDQDLDIIAITDHNTVAGYQYLFSLKAQLQNRQTILSEYENSSSQINDALKGCKEKLSLFDHILMIPGVEITVNPGIHMLVLADPDKLSDLSELLNSIGYTDSKRGSDNDIGIDVDIKNFLALPALKDFLVVAPHIDSDKGIYNSLTGQFRGEIMRSPSIAAFSCNSSAQKDKIIGLFKNDTNYKREFIPAFVNCSDAHNSEDVGKKFSYIKLPSPSLEEIQSAFLSPDGKIRDTNDQRLEQFIHKLIDDTDPVLISDPALVNTEDLSHYICACLNEGVNCIILGVTSDLKITGLKQNGCDFEKLMVEAVKHVESRYSQMRFIITSEVLGNGNHIVIIYLKPGIECLWYISENESVYILDDSTPVIATIGQIESLVQGNTLSEIEKLEQKNNHTALHIKSQIQSLTDIVGKYEIVQRLMLDSVPLLSIYNFDRYPSAEIVKGLSQKYFRGNGESDGNIYFIFKNPLRLPEAILRFTCPSANVPCDVSEKLDSKPISSNSIVISQGGGSHMITRDSTIVGIETGYLVLTPKETAKNSSHLLLAWLKSSLFTWFIYRKYNSTNIYLPEILQEAVIPYKLLKNIDSAIWEIVQEIVDLENAFITKIYNMCKKCPECDDKPCPHNEMVSAHNTSIKERTALIDQLIFNAVGIDEDGQSFIKEELEAAGIFTVS